MRSLSLSLISITGGGRLGVLTQPDSKVPGDQQRWYKFSRYFLYFSNKSGINKQYSWLRCVMYE